MYGLKQDWETESPSRCLVLEDYEGVEARWCSGCGDHAVLAGLQRLVRDEQLPPEKIVVVSGIGCSSRLPHYMKTYGFHGLHGRPLPVACGVRSRRPDLNVFVVTGDGDCCAICTAHWIHAVRYNMDMTVMLLDNNIYGLTKRQTSPTTPRGGQSNTHPRGSSLGPLNPLSVTLGIANASFVAQTVDWNPVHLYATLKAAYHHPGFAFVRILQRCPHFTAAQDEELRQNPTRMLLLTHPDGIDAAEPVRKVFTNRLEHDPGDLDAARSLASDEAQMPMGLLYRNVDCGRYDEESAAGIGLAAETKLEKVRAAFDQFAI